MLKRTALYNAHVALGARLIEFGGWEMPVHYSGIVDEHFAVRSSAGLFDISHMGEVFIKGAAATSFLNQTLTNDIENLAIGSGQYTQMCRSDGGTVDDLYVFLTADQEYCLIINASRIEADVSWLQECLAGYARRDDVVVDNQSDRWSAVAVQGPRAAAFIDACVDLAHSEVPVPRPSELKKNQIMAASIASQSVWLSRTGYTGEDGFEIVTPNAVVEALWLRVLDAGSEYGLKPVGLGARDTLRTEACYPLYGHELGDDLTPIEAGLGFFVSFEKGEFNGRAALWEQKQNGVNRKLVAFRMTDRSAPPRPHYPIWNLTGERIGEVTSGTQSPTLAAGIGMGFVPPAFAKVGTELGIEIRGRPFPAVVVSRPFYRATVQPHH